MDYRDYKAIQKARQCLETAREYCNVLYKPETLEKLSEEEKKAFLKALNFLEIAQDVLSIFDFTPYRRGP